MAKLTLTDIAAGYSSTTTINANNALIEAALENTLSRDGDTPNTMSADLDLNSQNITNLADGVNAQDAVTKSQLDNASTLLNELTDLDDVTTAAVTNRNVLVADGAAYVGRALVEADISDLGSYVSSPVGETDGGSGQTTYTTGDMLYSDSANSLAKLAVGTDGFVLKLASGVPTWAAAAGGGNVSNTGTPVNNQIAIWTDATTVEGVAGLTFDGTNLAATQFGGITSANLVDKSATETISGLWTMSGGINMGDAELTRPKIKDYGLTSTSPSSSSGSITLNMTNGNAFQTTLTENITTVTLSNPPASGTYGEIIWKVTQDSVARAITFPAAVKWPGGTAPTISTGSGDVDLITLKTWDGGTTWYGNFSQDYS